MVVGTRPAWAAPLAICCLLMILLLIAGTIVLALIPVYLPAKDVDANTVTQYNTIYAGYASNVSDGSSLTLANTNSLSTQLTNNAGLSADNVNLSSGSFASTTAANGKKRQISAVNPTCERATSLTGNIFVARYQIKYPSTCSLKACQTRYRTSVQNSLRRNYQTDIVSMSFTNGQTRAVQLVFCGFFTSDPTSSATSCTTETKNNIYIFDSNNILYIFNPTSFNLTEVGTLNCSSDNLYGISLQRNGILWVSGETGSLYNYNLQSKQCVSTNYAVNQSDFQYFSMVFVKDDNDNGETLYVSKQNGNGHSLGKIDLTTLTLSVVGNFTNFGVEDMATTTDGRLFGILDLSNYTIGEIDKTNANIIAQYPLGISRPSYYTYGFAPYNLNFLLFAGNDTNTSEIYLFNPSTLTSTVLQNISESIYGAAVSTCYGTT